MFSGFQYQNECFISLFQIDFALATFFVVYFFIRFLAADDKLMFIFTIESLVDFFTVPIVFLTGKKKKRILINEENVMGVSSHLLCAPPF